MGRVCVFRVEVGGIVSDWSYPSPLPPTKRSLRCPCTSPRAPVPNTRRSCTTWLLLKVMSTSAAFRGNLRDLLKSWPRDVISSILTMVCQGGREGWTGGHGVCNSPSLNLSVANVWLFAVIYILKYSDECSLLSPAGEYSSKADTRNKLYMDKQTG